MLKDNKTLKFVLYTYLSIIFIFSVIFVPYKPIKLIKPSYYEIKREYKMKQINEHNRSGYTFLSDIAQGKEINGKRIFLQDLLFTIIFFLIVMFFKNREENKGIIYSKKQSHTPNLSNINTDKKANKLKNLVKLKTFITNGELKTIFSHIQFDNTQLESELLRFVLHYYAKILFNFSPDDPEHINIANILIHEINNIELYENQYIYNDHTDDMKKLYKLLYKYRKAYSHAELFTEANNQRRIESHFSTDVSYAFMVCSVFSVIQAVLKKINLSNIQLLSAALKSMNLLYEDSYDYSNIKHLHQVPNYVYLNIDEIVKKSMPENNTNDNVPVK